MSTDQEGLPSMLRVRVLRLHALAQAVACGLVVGLCLFLATNWLVLKGGPVVGPHLGLLAQFLPGYTVSFVGSLMGLGYGFVVGFAAGWLGSTVYNRVALRAAASGGRA